MTWINGWVAVRCRLAVSALLLLSSIVGRSEMMLDPGFDSGDGTELYCEHVIPLIDGKILVCGAFRWYDLQPAPFIMRLQEDGTLDPTFQMNGVNDWVRHMVLQPDGKIMVGGAFSRAGGLSRNLIARLNADGSFDPTFDPGTGFEDKLVPPDPNPPYVFWMDQQPDGKIIAVGSFAKFNGQTAHGVARLNQDGSLDSTFQMGSGLDSWGRFVMVQPNGQIIVTGWFTDYNGFPCNRMVRLNPDGTPDPNFRPYFGDKTAIYHATLLPDGKMLVSGHSKSDFDLFKREIARLNPDGSQDDTFLGHTDNRTESILLQPDGKFLVCGWFDLANDSPRGRLARFNADGSVDDSFRADADFFVWNMALDPKGRLLIVGGFPNVMGVQRSGIARLIDSSTIKLDPPSSDQSNSATSSNVTNELTKTGSNEGSISTSTSGDTSSGSSTESASDSMSNTDNTTASGGISGTAPDPSTIQSARMIGGAFEVAIQTTTNRTYYLEQRSLFTEGAWNTIDTLPGNGALRRLLDFKPDPGWGCYRVRVE
jgi:uncharacterized delta-60 repeat protein